MAGPKTHIKVSGSWKRVRHIYVKVSGTWKKVKKAHRKVSGVWKLVHRGAFEANLVISGHTANYNVYNALVAAGWNQVDPVVATLTINSGIWVYATTTGVYGLTVSGLPAESTLAITNNGYIAGCGGAGGAAGYGNYTSYTTPPAGSPGGPALYVASMPGVTVSMTNASYILGGGGGGGVGASCLYYFGDYEIGGGGGGGGYSYATSAGGSPAYTRVIGYETQGGYGGNGGSGGGGAGGSAGTVTVFEGQTAIAGVGGAGGYWGNAGASGGAYQPAWVRPEYYGYASAGGAAGYAVVGYGNITWVQTGYVYGPTS